MNTVAIVLARSGEGWKSGPIGLAVILALCVAAYFLFKSMSKHLRKVREQFPVEPARRDGGGVPQPAAPAEAAEVTSEGEDRPPAPS